MEAAETYNRRIEQLIDEYKKRGDIVNNTPHKDIQDLNLQVRELNMIEMFINDLELILGKT